MSYWFNELPSDWNVVKVKNVFNMISGGTPKSDIEEYWSDSEVIWVTPEDLSKEGKYLNDSIRKISNLGLQNCSANVIKANSIVVSTRAPIGNVKVSTVPFTTNQGCKSLEAKGKVNINYYYYVIALAKEHLNNLGQGTTFLELSNYSLKNVFVPYPDINLQDLIAYYLDTKCNQIDELIVAKKKQISLLEQQRQSIITEAVTKGLNPNVKMKDSGVEWIGEVPEHWYKLKLKYLTRQIIDGTHHTPDYQDEGIPFLRVTDITKSKGKEINLKDVKYISQKEHSELAKRCRPENGDLLVSKNGTIGVPKVIDWDWEFSIFVSLCLIKLNKNKLNPYFASFYFESKLVDEQIAFGSKKSTIMNLHLDKVKEFFIFVPPLSEQDEIVKYLQVKVSEVEISKRIVENQIEKLKEYRQSLIYEAVTGKIDVRDMELY